MGGYILLPFLVVSVTAFSISESQDVRAVAGLNNRLAANLYKKLSAEGTNVFFSPVSISAGLAMLFYGARGETAEEMRRALGYHNASLTDNGVHSAFKSLMDTFSEDSATKEYILYVANAVLAQKGYPILSEYKNGLEEIYKAKAEDVDFEKEVAKAVEAINRWVKQKTNNQIDKLLDSVDRATTLVLLNAVYFKGTWMTPFDPKDTEELVFYNKGLDSEGTKVPMMYLKEELPYLRRGGFSLVELPYKGEDISMVILLPDALDGLPKLEGELTPNTLLDLRRETYKVQTRVILPKFKLEYEKTLNDYLRELGMKAVFENKADLSGISQSGSIAVSKIQHKAVVEVNEEGSEASGVSGVGLVAMSMKPTFYADHPFLFCIVDTRSDLILFQGRVNQL